MKNDLQYSVLHRLLVIFSGGCRWVAGYVMNVIANPWYNFLYTLSAKGDNFIWKSNESYKINIPPFSLLHLHDTKFKKKQR